jgi:uncharacterized membrane protein
MIGLPDWAPNVHPAIVHFPIALFVIGLVSDIVALTGFKREVLRRFSSTMYVLGGVATVATYFSGENAADSVLPSAEANPALTEHADLGYYMLWFGVVYAVLRIVDLLLNKAGKLTIYLPVVVLGGAGFWLMFETAEHGAELVYKYGVGVLAAAEASSVSIPLSSSGDGSALNVAPDGSWSWSANHPGTWKESFDWIVSDPDVVEASLVSRPDGRLVLALSLSDADVLFVAGGDLAGVQVDAEWNLDDFDGTAALVHNVTGADAYHFVEVGSGAMSQGRVQSGQRSGFDTQDWSVSGWYAVRAVGHGTHFRGYGAGRLVTHGHDPAAEAGRVGLRIRGSGRLLLSGMVVSALE